MSLYSRLCSTIKTWPFRGFRKIDGWLSDNEAQALYRLAQGLPADAVVVEIGSWQGKSTCCIAKGLAAGRIYAIDPFDASGEAGSAELYAEKAAQTPQTLLDLFRRNLDNNGVGHKVEALKGYSSAFVGRFETMDFLFIDGDHSIQGCLFDYEHFSGAVKSGGCLAFHDYHPERTDLGPTHVVDQCVRPSGLWEPLLQADSLIAFRRKG